MRTTDPRQLLDALQWTARQQQAIPATIRANPAWAEIISLAEQVASGLLSFPVPAELYRVVAPWPLATTPAGVVYCPYWSCGKPWPREMAPAERGLFECPICLVRVVLATVGDGAP